MVGELFDSGRGQPELTPAHRATGPRYLGVHFACCSVYVRVYVNRRGNGYIGHCPRCGRRVEFHIGPGGTEERFFTAY